MSSVNVSSDISCPAVVADRNSLTSVEHEIRSLCTSKHTRKRQIWVENMFPLQIFASE